ncbi:MAG: GDP-mannose 4,6-dehydratase [Candidatus Cloacimonetes bacterium 4572_55]|nr:MAG: GDP-mannose 4,6-dehydratase [Candidatus Cloacimonetes bacterium 4572_55]
MKILITGVTGFVGRHLARLFLQDNEQLFGISRNPISENKELDFPVYRCDILDFEAILRIIKEIKPDWIFHLAAQSIVPVSWKIPAETIQTNTIGTVNLFEAVRKAGIRPRIHVSGSSEVYGLVMPDELPIRETNPLRPLSPYAVSKVAQDMLCYQYHKSYRLPLICTRAFNHTGAGQSDRFVISSFAKQISRIEAGLSKPVIKVGNLSSIRDFTDVRDVVRAYRLALTKGEPGEFYNICSGKGRSIQEALNMLLKKSKVAIRIIFDSERMRPSDTPCLIGDKTKFLVATGWRTSIPFDRTLQDTLNYWRKNLD